MKNNFEIINSKPQPQIANFAFYIVILTFAFWILILPPQEAQAGFILQRPLYIGLDNGLVGYWSFDQQDMAGVKAYDKSGQGNTGTLTNGPVRKAGRIGQALEFDGSDDYVLIPSSTVLRPANNFTLTAWARFDNFSGLRIIIMHDEDGGGDDGYILRVDNTGKAQFSAMNANGFTAQTVTSNTTLSNSTWYHLAGVYRNSILEVYINGVLDASKSASGDVVYSVTTNVNLGRRGGTSLPNTTFMDGLIDDIRIYNRALSADEIQRLYKIGATAKIGVSQSTGSLKDGLVGYWTFDGPDMAGVKAYDKSGQGNTGTLTNGPKRASGRVGQALEFDGGNDLVNVPDAAVLRPNNGSWSVSVWAKPPNINQLAVLVSKRQVTSPWEQWGIFICGDLVSNGCVTAGQKVGAFFRTDGATERRIEVTSDTIDGNWHHYTMVADSAAGILRLYVDGVERSDVTRSSVGAWPTVDNTDPLRIADNNAASAYYSGLIDDIRIYNRALSADEIQRLYKIGATAKIGVSQSTGSLKDGLVGHWTFDGPDMAGNTAYDKSGQGNNGTLTNGPVRKAGRIGQALEFDGGNDYVNVNAPSSFADFTTNSIFTLSAWINPRDLTQEAIMDKRDGGNAGWRFSKSNTAARLRFTSYLVIDLDSDASTKLTTNAWQHVAVTYNAGSVTFYKDGRPVGTGSVSSISSSAQSVDIGRITDLSGFEFNGLLDDVRIYNRALSADEIRRLYNMGR